MNDNAAQIELSLLDGPTEIISLKPLSIREMPAYLAAFDDEVSLAALFAGKDESWSSQLTAASHNALIGKGEEINREAFEPWYRRRLQRLELLNPGFVKQAESVTQRAIEGALKA
ncbi:MAG: hypothetical protein H0X40_02995 [Chthoniobacterales bacterium]|nr:hypothetical protein [Chthoniobacterales bacterium]